MSPFTFGTVDYVVFVILLSASAGIGVYFGFFSKGGDSADEYLMGGKKMRTLPIAISLVASQLSGIAIMSIPVELYSFGINYTFTVLSLVAVVPVLCYVVTPVFYNNNISNCYEYLERRFNKETRQVITLTFISAVFLYLPVVMFVPSLAFSQVTGINVHLINLIICSICIFYTMLGGIKAVVWTDVVQGVVMVGATFLVAIVGIIKVGGLGQVIANAREGGRLDVIFDFDHRTRATVWNGLIGGFCMWTSYVGFNQSCVQRIVALPSISHARKSLYMFLVGCCCILLLNCFTGIIIYAKYQDCDPVTKGLVEKADKIMPYFVQDVIGDWYGMPGVFISCVFSASLSSISANMNSLAGIFYFDYIKAFVRHTERKANLIMKACVLLVGMYCVLAGYFVEQFKSIMQVIITLSGIAHGTTFGVFMLGMLIPRITGRVAFISLVASMSTMFVVIVGTQMKMAKGELLYDPLPTLTHGCEDSINNVTSTSINVSAREEIGSEGFSVFEISFFWYAALGGSLVWIFGILLSFLMPPQEKLDPELLSPIVKWCVKSTRTEAEEVPLNAKGLIGEKL